MIPKAFFSKRMGAFCRKSGGEGSGLALWACCPLIANESPARIRNEELGMKVAASPRIYMGRCPKAGGKKSEVRSLMSNF